MSGIGWEETLPVELWMDRETGQVTAVATLPRDRWLKARELGLDREPAPLAVILARALLEEAEAECPRPLAETAAAAGAFIDAAVAGRANRSLTLGWTDPLAVPVDLRPSETGRNRWAPREPGLRG